MKKLVSLTLALVLIVACLAGISFAADPIAKVETKGKTVEVATVEDMLAAIDASGTSVVTLLKDVSNDDVINVPFTCTLDLNGHKLSTTKSNAWNVLAAGSEKTEIVVKNGTIEGAMSAICWRVGSLEVDNCTLIGNGSAAVQILCFADATAAAAKEKNIIKNSTLASTIWVTLSFNSTGKDFSAITLTLENCDVYATKTNVPLSNQAKETKPGTYNLGKGVNFYTLGKGYVKTSDPAPTVTGEAVTQAEGVFAIEINGVKYEGLNKFSTPEMPAPVAPVVPETPTTPAAPATPSVPSTTTPDVSVPATGVSVVALGVMAMVSLAGAVVTKKH